MIATFVWRGAIVERARGARAEEKLVPVGLRGLCCTVAAAAKEKGTLERKCERRRKVEENRLVVVDGRVWKGLGGLRESVYDRGERNVSIS